MKSRWWHRLTLRGAAHTGQRPSAPPGPPAVVVWDGSGHELGNRIADVAARIAGNARHGQLGARTMRESDLNVVLVEVAGPDGGAAIRAAQDELYALAVTGDPGTAHLIVCWIVPASLREQVWLIRRRGGRRAWNIADLTMASSWMRHLARAGARSDALHDLSTVTSAAVEELAQTTGLLGSYSMHLLSYLSAADYNTVQLLVCEHISAHPAFAERAYPGDRSHGAEPRHHAGMPDWNGLDAVEAAIAERWEHR